MKKGVAFLSAIFLLAGCGGSSTGNGSSSRDYPTEVQENYLVSCANNASLASGLPESEFVDLCECTLEEIQDRYSLSEFLEAEQAVISGEASGIDMESIAKSCL